MKTLYCFSAVAGLLCTLGVSAQEPIPHKESNVSLRNEVQIAISKGLEWLKAHQAENGSWSNAEHPALTALPLLAFERDPSGKYSDPKNKAAARPDFLEKGYAFIRSKAKPDGGIYDTGLSNYNTSVSLVTLIQRAAPQDEPLISKARDFIVGMQAKGMANESLDGGIGYGPTGVSPKRQHPDLDNTLLALEALRTYKAAHPTTESPAGDRKDLNWQAAIDFVTRCQNLPQTNPKGSDKPENRGGFVYYPGFSNAAPADGSDPLRSYGSMTYAGLLSFIYADLKKDDQRVVAALEWLKKNYTVNENPGMGEAGLYYYLHLMSKGLTAAGVSELTLADGRKVDWARESASKFLELQKPDGSWINDQSGRWMEKDAVLVTCYAVLALENIYERL